MKETLREKRREASEGGKEGRKTVSKKKRTKEGW